MEEAARREQAVAEEVADVEIMLQQLRTMLSDGLVDEWKARKLARLTAKLEVEA